RSHTAPERRAAFIAERHRKASPIGSAETEKPLHYLPSPPKVGADSPLAVESGNDPASLYRWFLSGRSTLDRQLWRHYAFVKEFDSIVKKLDGIEPLNSEPVAQRIPVEREEKQWCAKLRSAGERWDFQVLDQPQPVAVSRNGFGVELAHEVRQHDAVA